MNELHMLNDEILLELIRQYPMLALTDARNYDLYQLACRRDALILLGNWALTEHMLHVVQQIFGISSYKLLTCLSRLHFWFFTPDCIRSSTNRVAYDPNEDPEKPHAEKWELVSGYPWGESLYANVVATMHLFHKTNLLPGRYMMYLNVRVSNYVDLCSVRIQVTPSPHVRQLGPQNASYWLKGARAFPGQHRRYKRGDSFQIKIGALDVCGEQASSVPVEVNIQQMGPWATANLLLNYFYFEKVSSTAKVDPEFWWFSRERFSSDSRWVQYRQFYEQFETLKPTA